MEVPRHAFEVRISIGGNDWDYVRRTMKELLDMVEDRKPEEVGCASGGWNGCHSIDVQRRDVTPDKFREELEAWRVAMVEEEEKNAATKNVSV